jgi:hypothetical protein
MTPRPSFPRKRESSMLASRRVATGSTRLPSWIPACAGMTGRYANRKAA